MEQPFKTTEVHAALSQYIRSRPDVGALKALGDLTLEPRNPFEPKAARAPRRWFLFFAFVTTLLIASCAYFGNLR
ncbi:MAG: hypothetical protein ACM3JB_18815 [Acidobacteriaceae bacterium]